MSRGNPIQRSFSSGEISPLLFGRSDYQRSQSGLRQCRGFLPLRQGGVTRAPGTIHRGSTRGNAAARLISFQFAADDAVILEFSALRMRVWRYGALVMTGATPYELVTPYDSAAVWRLKWEQDADIIDFVDGALPPQRLSRLALANWTIGPITFRRGPFRGENDDSSVKIGVSADTGNINLIGTGGPFLPAHVGSLIQLRAIEVPNVPTWVGLRATAVGDRWQYDGRIYEVTAGNNTGPNPPIHLEGTKKLGDGDFATMAYVSDLVGIVRVNAVTNANAATGTVLKRVPSSLIGTPTFRWSEGAWSGKNGYPSAIASEDQRRVYAATPADPRTMWFSTAGTDRDFEPGVDADSSFAYNIAGSRTQNRIGWLQRGARGLYVGTLGEEYVSKASATLETIGPQNAVFRGATAIGSRETQPIAPSGVPLFVARDGARLFELRYSLADEAFAAVELSLPSEHLGNERFVELAWQSSPLRLIWVRRADGTAAILLSDPNEDVLGWSVYSVAGGAIESIAIGPNAEGTTDVVTLVVRRTIDGQVRRYVEDVTLAYGLLTGAQPAAEAVHLYASVIRTGAAAAPRTIGGLDHLEGESVSVWSDRGDIGTFTVEGGQIAFTEDLHWFADHPPARLTIGLFDGTHILETMDVQVALPEGGTLGRQKRASAIGVRWHRTAAAEVSHVEREFGRPDRASPWRDAMNLPAPADLVDSWSGILNLNVPTGWTKELTYRFRPRGGAPMTLAALVAMTEVQGG